MNKCIASKANMEGQSLKFSVMYSYRNSYERAPGKYPSSPPYRYMPAGYIPVPGPPYTYPVPAFNVRPPTSYYQGAPSSNMSPYHSPVPLQYNSGHYYGMPVSQSYTRSGITGSYSNPPAGRMPSYPMPYMTRSPPAFQHPVSNQVYLSQPQQLYVHPPTYTTSKPPQNSPNTSLHSSVPTPDSLPEDSLICSVGSDDVPNVNIGEGQMLIRGSIVAYESFETKVLLDTGSSIKLTVERDIIYVNGKKINPSQILSKVIPKKTSLKVVFREVEPDSSDDMVNEKYTAVVAWFGDVPSSVGFVPSFSLLYMEDNKGSSEEDLYGLKNCSSELDLTNCKQGIISHIIGYVWWADKERGILRIYEYKGWGPKFSGILFTPNNLHFEGQKIDCQELHLLIAHVNKCEVYARKVKSKVVFGMKVQWEAVHVECGELPLSLKYRETGDDSDSSHYESLSDYASDRVSDDEDIDLTNNTSKPVTENSEEEENPCNYPQNETGDCKKASRECLSEELQDLSISHFNDVEYSGRHLAGNIVELCSDGDGLGVAKWLSMEYGDVFIKFKQERMYFDRVPLTKMCHIPPSVYVKSCNLYVLPIESEEYNGYTVRLLATCGWICAKPMIIPRPGSQANARVSITHLRLKSKKVKNKSPPGLTKTKGSTKLGPKSVCSDSKNIGLISPNMLNQAVDTEKHLLKPDDFKVSCDVTKGADNSINSTLEKGKPKNNGTLSLDVFMSNHSISSIYDSTIVSTDLLRNTLPSNCSSVSSTSPGRTSFSYSNTSSDKGYSSIDETNEQTLHTGEVVEVHSNMGKLLATDGTQHYFYRDHCFLYGISLRQVELWHVLVHGQMIQFRLSKTSTNRAKVTEVVIGSRHVNSKEEIASHINDWCKNNAVPDVAHNILVKQLRQL
ncbi:uncharacterized protein LOC121868361 isoform X2 [Homarus americanus]|uniref:Uncharacterized protein n=1 Tax=Homarus americanus TaxID=6706 RepID=A0A8J5KBV5_HOMAM|nr:uncharacterized protein LOC121868361 isoform X2 [Homarus americanus]KAG7167514.1 hypothetical protein Hamer_G012980 [Homarus americanus]